MFTKYFAEVYRLCLAFLSGETTRDHKIWVKVTRNGLPTILPVFFREALIKARMCPGNVNLRILRCLFTSLCSIRATSGHHTPKFGTITDPHKGIMKTLPAGSIKRALKTLGINQPIRLRGWKFILPEKSGVNANSVIFSIFLDTVAYWYNPSKIIHFVKFSWHVGFRTLTLTFILLLIVAFPWFIIYFVFQ